MKYFWKYGIPVYYSVLNGAVYYNGSYTHVKIYDGGVPPNATDEPIYIILGERLSTQTANKCIGQFDASLIVDIVDKTQSFGFGNTEDIANQIMGLINTFANPSAAPDFQIVTTSATTYNLSGLNPTDNIFRTLIRFEHKVLQL